VANEDSIGDPDLDELFYLNLNQDYQRFIYRLITLYNENFKEATENDCFKSKQRLSMLINRIMPSAKELKKVLREQRKSEIHKKKTNK
jgi:hypothetical protein